MPQSELQSLDSAAGIFIPHSAIRNQHSSIKTLRQVKPTLARGDELGDEFAIGTQFRKQVRIRRASLRSRRASAPSLIVMCSGPTPQQIA